MGGAGFFGFGAGVFFGAAGFGAADGRAALPAVAAAGLRAFAFFADFLPGFFAAGLLAAFFAAGFFAAFLLFLAAFLVFPTTAFPARFFAAAAVFFGFFFFDDFVFLATTNSFAA